MKTELIKLLIDMNPWLKDEDIKPTRTYDYIPREQTNFLLSADWDDLCLILTGPRQAGKTTLGKYIYLKKSSKRIVLISCFI